MGMFIITLSRFPWVRQFSTLLWREHRFKWCGREIEISICGKCLHKMFRGCIASHTYFMFVWSNFIKSYIYNIYNITNLHLFFYFLDNKGSVTIDIHEEESARCRKSLVRIVDKNFWSKILRLHVGFSVLAVLNRAKVGKCCACFFSWVFPISLYRPSDIICFTQHYNMKSVYLALFIVCALYFIPHHVYAMDDCSICEFIVKEVETFVGNNKTESEILTELDKACVILVNPNWIADCKALVNSEGPTLIQYVINDEPPAAACHAVGLCNASLVNLPPQRVSGILDLHFLVKDNN